MPLSHDELNCLAQLATVQIIVKSRNGGGMGSGFAVGSDDRWSYVVTNRHVVEGAIDEESSMLYPATGVQGSLRVIGTCPFGPGGADAVLCATDIQFLQHLRLSPRMRLSSMEPLFTFGYPLGWANWTTGCYLDRNHIRTDYTDWIDHDRASDYMDMCHLHLIGGASGSAVIDQDGEVVGICTRGITTYVTPILITPVMYVTDLLRTHGVPFDGGSDESAASYVSRLPPPERANDPERRNRNPGLPAIEGRPVAPQRGPSATAPTRHASPPPSRRTRPLPPPFNPPPTPPSSRRQVVRPRSPDWDRYSPSDRRPQSPQANWDRYRGQGQPRSPTPPRHNPGRIIPASQRPSHQRAPSRYEDYSPRNDIQRNRGRHGRSPSPDVSRGYRHVGPGIIERLREDFERF